MKAVLKDIERHSPDNKYRLDDLVNFEGWDNEGIALIGKNQINCIQGNRDKGIYYHENDFPFSY